MTISLLLEEKQAEYLKDIIDMWSEQVKDSIPQVDIDPGFDSIEELLESSAGIRSMYKDAVTIRQKLQEALQ